jgi:hypothetical protein
MASIQSQLVNIQEFRFQRIKMFQKNLEPSVLPIKSIGTSIASSTKAILRI